MGKHTTISVPKTYFQTEIIQEAMDELDFTSKSAYLQYTGRIVAQKTTGNMTSMFKRALEKGDFTKEELEYIITGEE